MRAKLKMLLVGPVWGLLAWGSVQCTGAPIDTPVADTPVLVGPEAGRPAGLPDSTTVLVSGRVEAGGSDPLLAHVTGRVRQVFFVGGEFVHRGQLLLTLDTPNYVLAPHDGFLGPCLVSEGQRVGRVTPVTTLSRRHHLVVSLRLHQGQGGHLLRAGDSVHVWVAARPTRVVTGIVGPRLPALASTFQLEIALPLRTPFHLGEQAVVQLPVGLPVD